MYQRSLLGEGKGMEWIKNTSEGRLRDFIESLKLNGQTNLRMEGSTKSYNCLSNYLN